MGSSVTFSVSAIANAPLSYQWQFNGTNNIGDGNTNSWSSASISGSSTTNLTITDATINDIGKYQVVVANFLGSVTSSVAKLKITLIPVITSQPQDATFNTNSLQATFSVTAIGFQPFSYQWYSGTNQLENGAYFTNGLDYAQSVINSANLTIQHPSTNFSENFQVIITNVFGSATSSVANLKY
jgi:hypothetical protein